jgi:hypothetical protein
MTMQTGMSALLGVGPPPQSGDATGILRWCARLFAFLERFTRQPEFSGVTLTLVNPELPADFKAQDGMLMYAGPGTLGVAGGLYLRDAGAWKLISVT